MRRVRSNLFVVPALGAVVTALLAAPIGCGDAEPQPNIPQVTAAPSAPPPPSASAVEAPKPAPPTPHKYAVATENATASRAAMDVLEKGGNAVDAAIAAVLTVGVAQPVSSGLGGGGFAMVWDAKKKELTVLDFREVAPMGLKPKDLAKRPEPEDKRGAAFGVPGEVAGIVAMHERWGKLAFADDVRVAADTADKGFPVSAHLARALKWFEAWVTKTPRYPIFAPGGALAAPGTIVKNPALAATLRRIAAEGKAAFYEGSVAKDILATARSAGSAMTEAELKGYKPVERAPLKTPWEGYEIATMPPPSAGGLYVLETLHMHTKAELAALGFGTGAYDHLLAETLRGCIADRVRAIGDPAFVKMDVAALASPARMKARRAHISMTATTPPEKFPLVESGTSHIVVVDADGDVVSMTSTINNPFGAKLPTAGGFLLNDELNDFTTEKVAKLFGEAKPPNAPRGGARPVSSMTPTMVFKDGQPVFALGGSGGMRIATGVPQVLLAHLVFGRSAAQAVADPRFEVPAMGGIVLDDASPALVTDLKARGEAVETGKINFSGVQAIAIGEEGGVRRLDAGADPRKGGSALVE
ncbi:MAG TPA: gamma-glutamyltransferase [Minicystis sp.]|nr:gamma-glutamyltransferase [Minicystis sp.]